VLAWLGLLVAAVAGSAGWASPGRGADARWNVLLITADDMNWDSPGWMGNPLKLTPNLDRLAAESCRFVNAHVTVPICQPGRSALMTGRVPHRNGALGFNPISTDVPTLVELLRQAGYYTAVLNKSEHMAPPAKFPWHTVHQGSGKNPQRMREQLEACLREAAQSQRPFFINANITDPHRPFYGSQQSRQRQESGKVKAKRRSAGDAEGIVEPVAPQDVPVPAFLEDLPEIRQELAEYYSSIKRLDLTLGEILQALAASGRQEQTIVIFWSDHGMSFPFSKATVYYNGTRSPVLLRYPGMGPPREWTEWVSSIDLMPTLLDLLGLPHPPGLDGRSWVPLLEGKTQPQRDYVVTHVNTVSSGRAFPQRCIRTATRALMFHAWADGQTRFRVEAMNGLSFNALAAAAERDARLRPRVDQFLLGTPLALYDLEKDPAERHNVWDDPAYAADRQRLSQLLLEHMERTGDPLLGPLRQALGQVP
jgi:N-sulfoglucosamine sulfohydrolase